MAPLFEIRQDLKTPKYLQIVHGISKAVLNGSLRKGDQIFSINELSDEFLLGRDTVQKAYNILRKKGILVSVPGKGFYIDKTNVSAQYNILLLFNKISDYKRQIYNSFVQALGKQGKVDLKIHHSNVNLFDDLLNENLTGYDYCVVMPHFYEQWDRVHQILRNIPPKKLVLLDKDVSCLFEPYAAVYQDFKNDIYNALEQGLDLLQKYDRMVLVQPQLVPSPVEILTGFRNFCMNQSLKWRVVPEINEKSNVFPGEAYVVIEETDLASLIKHCKAQKLKVGQSVGIISYNDTPLKEILLDGITVMSTDHSMMGVTAAKLILEHEQVKIKNPFTLIRRGSL